MSTPELPPRTTVPPQPESAGTLYPERERPAPPRHQSRRPPWNRFFLRPIRGADGSVTYYTVEGRRVGYDRTRSSLAVGIFIVVVAIILGLALATCSGPGPEARPAAPADLEAKALSPIQVKLSWKGPTFNGLSSYEVYRNEHFLVSESLTSYVDDTVLPGRHYTYVVYVKNVSGVRSLASNSAPVTTPLRAPPATTPPPTPAPPSTSAPTGLVLPANRHLTAADFQAMCDATYGRGMTTAVRHAPDHFWASGWKCFDGLLYKGFSIEQFCPPNAPHAFNPKYGVRNLRKALYLWRCRLSP